MRRDGSALWVLVRESALRGPDGSITGIVHRLADFSDRRSVVESLTSSQHRLAEAQRIARIGSWEWDVEHDGSPVPRGSTPSTGSTRTPSRPPTPASSTSCTPTTGRSSTTPSGPPSATPRHFVFVARVRRADGELGVDPGPRRVPPGRRRPRGPHVRHPPGRHRDQARRDGARGLRLAERADAGGRDGRERGPDPGGRAEPGAVAGPAARRLEAGPRLRARGGRARRRTALHLRRRTARPTLPSRRAPAELELANRAFRERARSGTTRGSRSPSASRTPTRSARSSPSPRTRRSTATR